MRHLFSTFKKNEAQSLPTTHVGRSDTRRFSGQSRGYRSLLGPPLPVPDGDDRRRHRTAALAVLPTQRYRQRADHDPTNSSKRACQPMRFCRKQQCHVPHGRHQQHGVRVRRQPAGVREDTGPPDEVRSSASTSDTTSVQQQALCVQVDLRRCLPSDTRRTLCSESSQRTRVRRRSPARRSASGPRSLSSQTSTTVGSTAGRSGLVARHGSGARTKRRVLTERILSLETSQSQGQSRTALTNYER